MPGDWTHAPGVRRARLPPSTCWTTHPRGFPGTLRAGARWPGRTSERHVTEPDHPAHKVLRALIWMRAAHPPGKELLMTDVVYPPLAARSPGRRRELAQESTGPSTRSALVFADGALPERTRQLIAVTVAHVTRCHYCIARPHQARPSHWRERCTDHGSHLGRRRDPRGWRLCPLDRGVARPERRAAVVAPGWTPPVTHRADEAEWAGWSDAGGHSPAR